LIANVKEWGNLAHVKLVLENERRLKGRRSRRGNHQLPSLFDVADILAFGAA
jgi:hypothetical protein